ncbi:YjgB family protein [Priestia koreensis]|uniref:YjgB family protein n=1 Tax=Priestia koreensis TaxID=284581 RepID=UPI0034580B48
MRTMKKGTKWLAATVLAGSALGAGAVAGAQTTHNAPTKTVSSTTQSEAIQKLHDIYKSSAKGAFPKDAKSFTLGTATKATVHKAWGTPEKTSNGYDLYPANMGHPGYAISYDAKGYIKEVRYLGRNVEADQDINGITTATLVKELGKPEKILTIPKTKEKDYVYQTGKYELRFIVGTNGKVDHVNLTYGNTAVSEQSDAVKKLHAIYGSAYKGTFPNDAQQFKVGVTAKSTVYKAWGAPYKAENGYDVYPANMGHPGYAFSYDTKGHIKEIRYLGRNIEADKDINGVTSKDLMKELGKPKQVIMLKETKETKYVYTNGKYEIDFIVGKDGKVDHVNLKNAQ